MLQLSARALKRIEQTSMVKRTKDVVEEKLRDMTLLSNALAG